MDFRIGYIRTRLSAMFFLQFFVWASWWVPVYNYVLKGLYLTEEQAGWIGATIPLGAIFAPLFVGYIADRFFATQHVLSALHIVGGVFLLLARTQGGFGGLMAVLMVATLSFMPTLALANSLTFRNIDDPDRFPRIAMWGTIGWIVSGQIVGLPRLLGLQPWEFTGAFFYLAGAAELLLGLYCLTLPHTPPKGAEPGAEDVFGLKALALLKEPSFLLFAGCAFLIAIFAMFYFYACLPMLVETDRPAPVQLMTLGQVTEICVMFSMPWFIAHFGLRALLTVGMATWCVRYLFLSTMAFPLVLLGIIVHGFAYCFVFVGSYIYVDKKAPSHLRASAQSLIAFLMLGVGMFLGNLLSGYSAGQYPAYAGSMAAEMESPQGPRPLDRAPLPKWEDIAEQLGTDPHGAMRLADLDRIPEAGFKEENRVYAKKDLIDVFRKIDDRKPIQTRGDFRSAVKGEISVTRADWLAAQLRPWTPMWLWFALAAGVVCAVFAVGSAFTTDEEPARPEVPEAKPQPAEPSGPAVTPPDGSPPLIAPEGGPQPPA
jgi:nucleoside transporter